MLFFKILSREVQAFIENHIHIDINTFLLSKPLFEGVSNQEIAQQIKGKKTALRKFPFLNQKNIIFPPNLNLEQASSEETARYKTSLLKQGNHFIDLTCGFGIDSFFISEKFKKTTLIERDASLLEIVKHNWSVFNKNADFLNTDLVNYLASGSEKFDLIYLDPARRDENNRKKFLLEDLSPNIIDLQDILLERSEKTMIKLSPLIDLKHLTSSIQNISEIHIVAIKNEVKELLVVMDKTKSEIHVFCANLNTTEPNFSFKLHERGNISAEYSLPLDYIYLPNNSILKAGAFHLIAERFGLKKLDSNSHIYTSEKEISDFPGRILKVQIVKPKEIIKGTSYNIISKNYPLTPQEIKDKYKIKDGGEGYLIFTQALSKKIILKSL